MCGRASCVPFSFDTLMSEMVPLEMMGSTEETVGVRAELVNSLYRLTDMEGGKTRVEVEIQTDPKGWMPIWLVNLVQKDWPLETLNGMRGELSKDYCGDSPLPEMNADAEAKAEPNDAAEQATEGSEAAETEA